MNMISQLRQRVKANGMAEITQEEFDQLHAEWIMRVGAEDLVLAERDATIDKVLTGLRSENDTTQLRAIIVSVEAMRSNT